MKYMLNFAYGSNMYPEQFKERCPKSQYVGKAVLNDYTLIFPRESTTQKGGVASIEPKKGERVEGVICDVHPDDLPNLRRHEGFQYAYNEKEIEVVTAEGKHVKVVAYVAVKVGAFLPSKTYMNKIIWGAVNHGLSEEYVAGLRTIKTK